MRWMRWTVLCGIVVVATTTAGAEWTAAAAPWRDPAVGALARGAEIRLGRAGKREATAAAKVAGLERAIARERELIEAERAKVAAHEEALPALREAQAQAERDAASAETSYREAALAERVARKEGGRAALTALAERDARREAWLEARRAVWRATAAVRRNERGIETAKDRGAAAERRLAAREGQLQVATRERDAAVAGRELDTRWVAATKALRDGDRAAALAAEASMGAAPDGGAAPADRAFLRCVAADGIGEERVASCRAAAREHVSAHRYLALAYFRADRVDDALSALAEAPPADDDVALRTAAGVALVRAGRPGDAVTHLEAALAVDRDGSDAGDALDALADAYLALKRHASALSALERLAKLDPTRAGIDYRRALAYAELGEEDRATLAMASFVGSAKRGARDPSYAPCRRDLYRELVTGDEVDLPPAPNKPLGHVYLAQQALAGGDVLAAEEHFAAALALAPDDPDVHLRVGLFRLRAGDLAGAEEHLAPIVEARGEPRARTALGVALSRQGRQREAIAALSQVAADDARGQLALGVAQARAGEREAARATLRRVADDDEVGADARHDLAVLSFYAEERDALAKQLADEPATTPEGHLLRGLVALAGDDAGAAVPHLERALAIQPAYLQAQIALGRALDRLDRGADAQARLREAVATDPACPDAHVQLGAVLARAGDGEAAAAEYRKAETLREALRQKAALEAGQEAGADAGAAGVRRLAVVHFINANADPRWEWLSFGIAEAVSTDLAQLSSLEVIERGQVAAVMREIKFSSLDFVDASTAPKIGNVLSVDTLVVGSYQVIGERIRIDGRLVELATQRVLESARAEGPMSDLFALERSLALDLVGRWARVGDAERTSIMSAPSGSVGGLEQLALTRVKMLQGDAIGAKKAYREAVARSPELARRVQDMRSAYEDAEARVAILPFKNASQDPEAEWLGVGISESLATDMRKIGLYVVERNEIAKAMTEQKFGQLVEPERAARLGLLVGAQFILIGSYQSVGDMLAIDARMVQVETGAVALTERVSGRASEFFELQRKLSAAIAKALDLQVGVEELAALVGDEPDLADFKETILKDRLFVLRKPAEPDDGGAPSLTAPIIVGLGGLAAGITGGVLYGLAESRDADSNRELALYRRSVDPAEIALHYDRARDLGDDRDTLRIASYVAFGVAGVAVVYSTWALIDAASEQPETSGRTEVVGRKGLRLAPAFGPSAAGLDLAIDF